MRADKGFKSRLIRNQTRAETIRFNPIYVCTSYIYLFIACSVLPRGEIKRFYNDAMLGKNEMFHIMHMYCTCTYCRVHIYNRVAAEVFSKGNMHRAIDKL